MVVAEKNDLKHDINIETKEVAVKKETEEYYFPLESHLRDFIVQNIDTIEGNGKSLKLYGDENGTDGIEFRTEVGIIDILAIDENDDFVIFELKLSRGNDATLGQILRYMDG